MAAVAHAGFQDPPFTVFRLEVFVLGEAVGELVGFHQRVVKEFGVVDFELAGFGKGTCKCRGGVFSDMMAERLAKVVLADEGLSVSRSAVMRNQARE